MPTVKKEKLEKVIKSIDKKKDILTLECEWEVCDFVCNDTDSFLTHISRHIDQLMMTCGAVAACKSDTVFECLWRDCGHEQSFQTQIELQRHLYFHAFHTRLKSIGASLSSKNALPTCQFDSSNRNNLPELYSDQLKCSWHGCENVFDIPDVYYSHVSQHADLYPSGNKPDGGCTCLWEGCGAVVRSKHRLKEHLRTHTQERTMACMTCGSLFANATKMYDHIQRQNFSKTHHYECSHCNKSCATERLLRDHMRQHVNHYRCPYCDKTCPNPSSLKIHVHYRHTEDRPYKCPHCNYWAKTAVDLRRHYNTHGQVKIACEVADCTYHARYYWEMNLHCQIAHEGNESKKYICHLCNCKFGKGFLLTRHLRLKHHYALPSGHKRFRYKQDKDGYYRLLAVRYESTDMKEQLVPGLTSRHMSQDCSSGMTLSAASRDSSVAFSPEDSPTGDAAVPMSNLELLGSVAFAMSQPDDTDECTDIRDFALADGQMPCDDIIYVVPTSDDGAPQSFATVLQPTVEPLPVADGENMVDSDSARSMSDITNTSCLYFGTLTDSCGMSCTVGSRLNQYGMCDGAISTNERYDDNMATSCMEDELAGCESGTASANVVTSDGRFIHDVDMSLESFSLSVLTNVVTS